MSQNIQFGVPADLLNEKVSSDVTPVAKAVKPASKLKSMILTAAITAFSASALFAVTSFAVDQLVMKGLQSEMSEYHKPYPGYAEYVERMHQEELAEQPAVSSNAVESPRS